MLILIDYDNIDQQIRKNGIKDASDRILGALTDKIDYPLRRATLRLYGGWYDEKSITHSAQKLTTELQDVFPYPFRSILESIDTSPVMLRAELAYSLLSSPKKHLLSTYRIRENIRMRVRSPSALGCDIPDCGLRHIKKLVTRQRCPEESCSLSDQEIKQILWRKEQKLVDTMLASDIFYAGIKQQEESIAVLSSDDDIWPAILQAVSLNIKIFHIHGKLSYTTPSRYESLIPSIQKKYYEQINL